MIKNIVYDIGMVLIDFAWAQAMRDLGYSEETIDFLDKNFVNHELWDELDRGVMEESDVINLFCERHPQYEEEIRKFWDNNILTVRPYDYSAPWVKDMKDIGLNTYLLTNYPDTLFDKSVKYAFPFYPYIDGEIVSSRVKIRKPDEGIYKALLEKYNLKAEECLFFDDRIINIEAAKKLGFNAHVFTSYEEARAIINSYIK